jgi:hypothetical protein
MKRAEGLSAPVLHEKPSEQQDRALRRYSENAWLIERAMEIAPWDQTLSAGISKLMKAATPDWDHVDPSHSEVRGREVATRLRPWLEMAQKLPPAKQAAALLVADRIVVMEEEDGNLEPQPNEKYASQEKPSGKPPKSVAQVELERLGAQFSYEEGSERYFYTCNWLQRSYDVDPNGRAGELAFIALMRRGFDTSVNCAKGSDQFREVIRRGGEFIRGNRSADIEARVHFMVGDAYRDIVALAAGLEGDNYADPNNYKAEAAEAPARAMAEFRAGLALDDKSEDSKIAKQHLASLEAGETPHSTRFYCQLLD